MDPEPTLDPALVSQTINFHGQQLQKMWENERGESELSKLDQIDFAAYQGRQKNFQDRGKRVMLHQFIAKEASALFDSNLLAEPSACTTAVDTNIPEDHIYALMPPFESFMNVDKGAKLRHFFENLQSGDLIIGTVINRSATGMMLKVLCMVAPTFRYVADINVKAFVSISNVIPAVDKKNVSRNYIINDFVCCEVLEVIPDTDKISCGMKGITRSSEDPSPKPPLGLISSDDFPPIHKNSPYYKILLLLNKLRRYHMK